MFGWWWLQILTRGFLQGCSGTITDLAIHSYTRVKMPGAQKRKLAKHQTQPKLSGLVEKSLPGEGYPAAWSSSFFTWVERVPVSTGLLPSSVMTAKPSDPVAASRCRALSAAALALLRPSSSVVAAAVATAPESAPDGCMTQNCSLAGSNVGRLNSAASSSGYGNVDVARAPGNTPDEHEPWQARTPP
jgi:hypothetical protein